MNTRYLSLLAAMVLVSIGLGSCESDSDSPLPVIIPFNNNFVYDSPPDLGFYQNEFLGIDANGAEFDIVAKNYKSFNIKPIAAYSLISSAIRIDDITDYARAFHTNNYWNVDNSLKFNANTLKVENDSTFSTPYVTITQSPDNNHKFRIKVSANSTAKNRIFILCFRPQTERAIGGFVYLSQAGE